MKKLIITSILTVLVTAGTITVAQNNPDEYLGLPGDNLNLYAVMNLFQKSETLEGFERTLNDENSRINNLDLNGDRMVDYIMVKDYIDGNVHNIVLRVALNRKEYQDVAVFTVQRFRNGSVEIQLIGDEALYGKNYIIEPIYADNYGETPNPGYTGSTVYNNITVVRTSPFEIAAWPLIRFIYMPNYVVWSSSWYWGYYPSYWHPWHPYYWHYYYGYHYHWFPQYYSHYHHWNQYRYQHYNDFYYNNIRSHSPYVSARIKEGHYKSTYSHPEQRRNGEALYAKMHPDNNKRTSDNTVNRSQERRSVSQQTQERAMSHESSANTRRSTNTSINKGIDRSEKDRSGSSSRRTLNNYTSKKASESEQNRYSNNSRNSNSNGNYKTVERREQANNAAASRRSPATINERISSRPQQNQKAQTSDRSRQSNISAGTSDRRSTKQSKSGPAVASKDNAKESSADKTSRRR